MHISLAPFPIFLLWVSCKGYQPVWGGALVMQKSFQLLAGAAQQIPRGLDCRLHETVTKYPPYFISQPCLTEGFASPIQEGSARLFITSII